MLFEVVPQEEVAEYTGKYTTDKDPQLSFVQVKYRRIAHKREGCNEKRHRKAETAQKA